jgi:hypothetical protein
MSADRIARMRELLVRYDAALAMPEGPRCTAELALVAMDACRDDLPALLDELEAARAINRTARRYVESQGPCDYVFIEQSDYDFCSDLQCTYCALARVVDEVPL